MDAGTFIVWILGICVVYRLLNKLLDVIKTKKETRVQKYKDITEFWDKRDKEGRL